MVFKDKLNTKMVNHATVPYTSITTGQSGNCTFDLTAYSYSRGIGIITINENQGGTGIVVFAFGREGTNSFRVLALNNYANTTLSYSGNIITLTKSSYGLWMASMSIMYN